MNFLVLSELRGKKVRVYRNLHKKTFSVMSWEGENKGRVVDHKDNICLKDCKFVVQPAGRKRVLEEERKNVHAFVEGIVTLPNNDYILSPVTYNPYEGDAFVYVNGGAEIETSEYVALREGKYIFSK